MKTVLLLPLLVVLGFLFAQQPGLSLYTVLTGSMEPYVPRGSLVVVENTQPALGDIAAYRVEANGRSYVIVHRVVGVGDGYYVFRGDAAGGVEAVSAGDVLGRVALAVPYVGYLYIAGLANPLLVGLLLVIAAFLPARDPQTLFPLSFGSSLLAFLLPGRGLTAVLGPHAYFAFASSVSILLYFLERRDGPHTLITISHVMLAVANLFSVDLRGVASW